MNFTLNNKYFKGSSPLFWIGGLVALAAGITLLFVQDMLGFGIILGVAALIYLGIYFGSRAKDSDITDGLNIRLEELRGEARADYESQFDNTKKVGSAKIYEFSRFVYHPVKEGETLKTRRSSFGELFTSRYSMTLFYVDDVNRMMYVYICSLNLLEDDDEMEISVLPYGGFDKAWLTDDEVEVEIGKEKVKKTDTMFHVSCRDGSEVSFPAVRDSAIETLTDDMNMRYSKADKQ